MTRLSAPCSRRGFFAAGALALMGAAGCARGGAGRVSAGSGEPGGIARALSRGLAHEAASVIDEAPDMVLAGRARREEQIRADLDIVSDIRPSFAHGEKPAEFQRYIVLHDTEGSGTPESVVRWWDESGNLVAAHFVVGRDGHVVQCVELDSIAHHAGYGDNGHNELYGVTDETRDDKLGTGPGYRWAGDYGMNSYSVGIELVHVGGAQDYPPAQLEALDSLIALIDAHYGFESQIIDHKAWRSGNSDTSQEFAVYLQQYQTTRTHDGEGL